MKKTFSSTIMIIMAFALILSGCGGGGGGNVASSTAAPSTAASSEAAPSTAAAVPEEAQPIEFAASNVSGEVTMWTFVKEFKDVADAFMKEYPNIKVKVVDLGWEVHDKLATTLAAGKGAPDLAVVEQGQFPRYATGGVLEDLLQPPFEAGRFKDDVSEYNWSRWMSVDGKKLLGMPWDTQPGVLYYRSDIYEQLGLPSDPTELGEYFENPENVFTAVQTLKADGKYFMEWGDGPVHWGGDEVGFFDTELNWTRNTDRLVELLDFTKRGEQLKWGSYVGGLWDDKGKAMIKKGEITGLVLGAWGAWSISQTFPELKGKWRATKLPFGVSFGMGGSSLVMPSQSKNKEAAWAFMEWSMRSEAAWEVWSRAWTHPGWKHIQNLESYSSHTNEYLGGQEDYKLYAEIEANIPPRTLNPLDGKAWPIWLEGVKKGIEKNLDSKAILQEIQENIQNKLKPDIDKMKAEMGK